MTAAAVVVPGAVAGMVAVDVGSMLDSPAAATGLAAVDVVPALGISVAVEPQQVVGMVEFLNRVHNLYSSSLALNSGHNKDSALFALPSLCIMILLALVYHTYLGWHVQKLVKGLCLNGHIHDLSHLHNIYLSLLSQHMRHIVYFS